MHYEVMEVGQCEGATGFRCPPAQVLLSLFWTWLNFVALVSSSPQGQHHDSTCFHQLLCLDPSCEVCNNTTTGINWLPFSLALEDAIPIVFPLAFTAPVAEPLFHHSLSPLPSQQFLIRQLIPPPLPEPFLLSTSILPTNPAIFNLCAI